MVMLLQNWEVLVGSVLNPSNTNVYSLTEEAIRDIIKESEEEMGRIRSSLVETIVDTTRVADKERYVQLHQAMLIRLLDKIHIYTQGTQLPEKSLFLYNSVTKHLESILHFIEDFLSNYFDRNEKVPISYLIISIEDLRKQLEKLKHAVAGKDSITSKLIGILINNFYKSCSSNHAGVTYNELMYQKDLMNELLNENVLTSDSSIKEVLFYFGYNDDDIVSFFIDEIAVFLEGLQTKREKIAALRLEQKNINQLRSKVNCHLSMKMPSLKDQINQWIGEEIKFLESEQVEERGVTVDVENKIYTSLSVSKLALLIRLMIIDKTITNRVVAHALRVIVKTFTTLQKENISFGSLESKYHTPDKGTIAGVKEMLFRWIHILNKL